MVENDRAVVAASCSAVWSLGADGDGVDALVDAADALAAVDVHEGGDGARGLDTRGGDLVLGDLNGLHAGAEAHGGVGLGDAAGDAADDAAAELGGAGDAGVVLGLGGDEEQDGALGGGLDPGPGDEALVEAEGTAAGPDAAEGGGEAVAAVGGHGGLYDLEGLAEGGDLEEVEAGAEEEVGELDGLLLEVGGGLPDGRGEGGSSGRHDC